MACTKVCGGVFTAPTLRLIHVPIPMQMGTVTNLVPKRWNLTVFHLLLYIGITIEITFLHTIGIYIGIGIGLGQCKHTMEQYYVVIFTQNGTPAGTGNIIILNNPLKHSHANL